MKNQKNFQFNRVLFGFFSLLILFQNCGSEFEAVNSSGKSSLGSESQLLNEETGEISPPDPDNELGTVGNPDPIGPAPATIPFKFDELIRLQFEHQQALNLEVAPQIVGTNQAFFEMVVASNKLDVFAYLDKYTRSYLSIGRRIRFNFDSNKKVFVASIPIFPTFIGEPLGFELQAIDPTIASPQSILVEINPHPWDIVTSVNMQLSLTYNGRLVKPVATAVPLASLEQKVTELPNMMDAGSKILLLSSNSCHQVAYVEMTSSGQKILNKMTDNVALEKNNFAQQVIPSAMELVDLVTAYFATSVGILKLRNQIVIFNTVENQGNIPGYSVYKFDQPIVIKKIAIPRYFSGPPLYPNQYPLPADPISILILDAQGRLYQTGLTTEAVQTNILHLERVTYVNDAVLDVTSSSAGNFALTESGRVYFFDRKIIDQTQPHYLHLLKLGTTPERFLEGNGGLTHFEVLFKDDSVGVVLASSNQSPDEVKQNFDSQISVEIKTDPISNLNNQYRYRELIQSRLWRWKK